MPIKINGSTSGSVTLAAPATGSDVTLTLPAASGTAALASALGKQVLQVTIGTRTTEYSANTWNTDFFVFEGTITPTSASSKIIALAFVNSIVPTSGGGRITTTVKYDTNSGTNGGTTLASSQVGYEGAVNANGLQMSTTVTGIVTAGTTSPLYFKVLTAHADRDSTGTWYVGRYNVPSQIILVEIQP